MSDVIVSYEGLPAVHKMLEEFKPGPINNRLRRALRAGAAIMRTDMRAMGNRPGFYPSRFRKTRTRYHRNPVGVSVSPQSPLSTVFEHGARPHMIGNIHHPGMAARPFIAPVFVAGEHPAEAAIEATLLEGL